MGLQSAQRSSAMLWDAMLEAVAVFPHTVATPALLSTVCTAANMHFGALFAKLAIRYPVCLEVST